MKHLSCQTYEQLSIKAAAILVQEIGTVISRKGKAILALPGGRSVIGLLQELSPKDLDWSKVEIFMIDERVVPIDDAQSNYKQAQDLLLKRINAKSHPFILEKGMEHYNREFQRAGAHFDVVVLGVGEDGHVAALFPDHPALDVKGKNYIALGDAPKLPSQRITASADIIQDADVVLLLFVSAGKKKAYEQFLDTKVTIASCPAKLAMKAKKVFVLTEFLE